MKSPTSSTPPRYVRYMFASVTVVHAIGFGMVLATATDWGRAYGLGIGAVMAFFTSTVSTVFAVVLWLRSRTKPSEHATGSAP